MWEGNVDRPSRTKDVFEEYIPMDPQIYANVSVEIWVICIL